MPPCYEYECLNGHEFEQHQKITEAPLETCILDNCQAPCKRLISKTTFRLMGNGWNPKPDTYWKSAVTKDLGGTKGK